MSDSESDTFIDIFSKFQNGHTTVSGKGPNTNMTSFSIPSTMRLPRNFERQRYAECACEQRSMCYRRETSPMSIHSTNSLQYYPGMGSQQSVFHGRRGSPMSVRSIDSNASAAEIALALKDRKFNKNELKVIKAAYHKLMKRPIRKRIEKRRNNRLFPKGKGSDGDSGAQGSNSSISSDDDRSIKTYEENMSSTRSARIYSTDFRKTVRCSNMLKDYSENFEPNTFKNKISFRYGGINKTQNVCNNFVSKQSNLIPTQKDRFRNGFLLASQRFNSSVASSAISERSEKPLKNAENNGVYNVKNHYAQNKQNKNNNSSAIDDEDEIFSEMTLGEKSIFNTASHCKRSLDSEDESNLPDKKKSKISPPVKNTQLIKKVLSKPKNVNTSNKNVELSKGFEFAKPSLPVRKSKPRVQEILIAKSSQSLTDFLEPVSNEVLETVQILQPTNLQEKLPENLTQLDQSETTQYSDVSMRPSFMKRKLYTQKLDVAENANLSNDCVNSPQSNVYSLQKEKNKTRKLVTNQSCLNRVVQDDSDILDLIHKIVPPDRMNITNQTITNQTKNYVHNKNNKDDKDKWDVTSVISMCNEDEVSDTYTDEEIFEGDNTNKENIKNKDTFSKTNPKTINTFKNNIQVQHHNCRVLVDKLQNNNTIQKQTENRNDINNFTKNNVKSSIRSFWDTDSESDSECKTTMPRSNVYDILKKANAALEVKKQDLKNSTGCASSQVPKHFQQTLEVPKQINNTMNNTFDRLSKLNPSTLSIRSHRTLKKKICCNETSVLETKSKSVNESKISVDKKKHYFKEINKKSVEKLNFETDIQSKNPTNVTKSKLNTGIEKLEQKSRSQSKKSPDEKTTKKAKHVESLNKNNNKKSGSKPKPEKAYENIKNNLKSKPETPKNNSSNKIEKQTENRQLKTVSKTNKRSANQKNTSPKNKTKSKTDCQNSSISSKKNIPVPHATKPNIDNSVESKTDCQNRSISSKKNNPVRHTTTPNINNSVESIQQTVTRSGRPLRSCRISSQSRSVESFRSSIDFISLRSRVINLSSSIENTTTQIKPRNKTINNIHVSKINTRKSDVSFSLRSDKHTPRPTKK